MGLLMMNKKNFWIAILLLVLPMLSFATTGGDATFSDISTQLEKYLGGSLGYVFILIGFIGAAAAIAGFAPMKIMFPIFGLALVLRFGPSVLKNVFSSDGTYYLHDISNFTLIDLILVLVASTLFVIWFYKKRSLNGFKK